MAKNKRKSKTDSMPDLNGYLTLILPVSKRKTALLQRPIGVVPTQLLAIADGIAQIEDRDEIEQLCSGAILALDNFELARKDHGNNTSDLVLDGALFLLLVRSDERQRGRLIRTIATAERGLLLPHFLADGLSLRLELNNAHGFPDAGVLH